jgi:hypothetical protein
VEGNAHLRHLQKMVQAVKSTPDGTKCMLHIDGEVREVPMKNGSGQGTILCPLLSGFSLLPIMELWVAKRMTAATIVHVSKPGSSPPPPLPQSLAVTGTPPWITTPFTSTTSRMTPARQTKTGRAAQRQVKISLSALEILDSTSALAPSISLTRRQSPCFPLATKERVKFKTKIQLPYLSNGTFIPRVQSTVCLGHAITGDLKDEARLNVRGVKATQVHGALGPHLMRCRHVWKEVRRLVFVTMILPTVLDGIECFVLTKKGVDELATVHHRMARSSARVAPFTQRKCKLTSEELLSRPDLHPLHHYIDLKVLGHAGHVERVDERRLPRVLRGGDMEGKNTPGGQHKTHAKTVTQTLMRKGITVEEWKELAVQKDKWRAFIQEVKNPSVRITGAPPVTQLELTNHWKHTRAPSSAGRSKSFLLEVNGIAVR